MDLVDKMLTVAVALISPLFGTGIVLFVLFTAVPTKIGIRTVFPARQANHRKPQQKKPKPPTIWPVQPFETGHIVEVTRDNSRNQHRGRRVPAGVFGKVTRVATHTVRVEFFDHSFRKSQRSCWMDAGALTLVPRLS